MNGEACSGRPLLKARVQRQRFGFTLRHASPAGVTRIARLRVAVQVRADDRVEAIGSDEELGVRMPAIGKSGGEPSE